jgi:hypothetical protein
MNSNFLRNLNINGSYIVKSLLICLIFFLSLLAYVNQGFAQKKEMTAENKAKINAEGKFPKDVNPHDQINDSGELQEKMCLLCHPDVPDPETVESIAEVKFIEDKFKDLKDMCFTCHPEDNHPAGSPLAGVDVPGRTDPPDHLIKPTEEVVGNMESSLEDGLIILPLDPQNGKITCVTCHNPHEKGVLLGPPSVGADTNLRLRNFNKPLCLYCHNVS